MKIAYSIKEDDDKTSTRAMGRDLDISFKNSVMICNRLRGMMLSDAIRILEAVITLDTHIPFTRFNKGIGHRKGNVQKIGKYPKKAAYHILKILENLERNAEYKGIYPETLRIEHIQAQQGITRRRVRPKGRWRLHRRQLVHVQVIAREVDKHK